jgi:hypothetical protein
VIGVVGVQRGQAQVAGLGVGEGGGHGLAVADLADQDAVGGLAHGVAQGVVPVDGVGADLALVDDRHLVLEQIFDRVFDGQDVARAVLVAVVQHRGDGGGLARAGGADDQHQPALLHDDVGEHRRQAEVVERGCRRRCSARRWRCCCAARRC